MSILTITKEDSFNNYIPSSHIDKVKALSDARDLTNDLTRSSSHIASSHGKYAAEVRNHNDDRELTRLAADVDSATYFDQYDLQGNH